MLQPAQPPAPNLVVHLDEDLRAALRRDGLDPLREVPAVRRLAESLVRDHDDRSLTGMLAPVADVDGMVAELVARVSGFGPLQPLLDARVPRKRRSSLPTGRPCQPDARGREASCVAAEHLTARSRNLALPGRVRCGRCLGLMGGCSPRPAGCPMPWCRGGR